MNYLGFLAGQIVVVLISWSYWMGPGKQARAYWGEHAGQHVGDAGLALFVFVAWGTGMLGSLAHWAQMPDLAEKIPASPEGMAGGFVSGGACSVLAWLIHARWKKRRAAEGGS